MSTWQTLQDAATAADIGTSDDAAWAEWWIDRARELADRLDYVVAILHATQTEQGVKRQQAEDRAKALEGQLYEAQVERNKRRAEAEQVRETAETLRRERFLAAIEAAGHKDVLDRNGAVTFAFPEGRAKLRLSPDGGAALWLNLPDWAALVLISGLEKKLW
jgi:hypothetical protein